MHRLFSTILLGLFAMTVLSCRQEKDTAQQDDKIRLKSPDVASYVKGAIALHIEENTDTGNHFIIQDEIENRGRKLKFGYVHDSVHETGDGRYFACVDFTETPDDTLDLDFYVTFDSDGNSNVYEVIIHKVNGVSRL